MKKYDNIPLDSQLPQYDSWRKQLIPGSVGNVFFLPWIGMMYRVAQFLEYLGKGVSVVDIQDIDGEGIELISNLPKSGKVVVILRRAMLSPDGIRLAREIEKWLIVFEGGVIFVHETTPLELAQRSDWPSWVMANQMIYQMADKGVVTQYLENVASGMEIKLGKDEVEDIVEACGGWLWLAKDILRGKAEDSKANTEDLAGKDSFVQKMSLIWSSWPESYRKYVLGLRDDEMEKTEMTSFAIIEPNGDIRGKELKNYVLRQKEDSVKVGEDRVEFQGRDLTDKFTHGELKVLAKLKSSKEIVGRDEVANLFWEGKNDGDASDWALDQKMKRLRKKIMKLKIPLNIVTKKGQGYGI